MGRNVGGRWGARVHDTFPRLAGSVAGKSAQKKVEETESPPARINVLTRTCMTPAPGRPRRRHRRSSLTRASRRQGPMLVAPNPRETSWRRAQKKYKDLKAPLCYALTRTCMTPASGRPRRRHRRSPLTRASRRQGPMLVAPNPRETSRRRAQKKYKDLKAPLCYALTRTCMKPASGRPRLGRIRNSPTLARRRRRRTLVAAAGRP